MTKYEPIDDACIWIIKNQFGRRNLAPFTRVELALKLEPLIAAKAKQKQRESGGAVVQKSGKPPIKTERELAALAGVSHDTIAKGKLVAKHADNETKHKLRTNQVSIHRIAKDIKETQQRAARKEKRTEAAKVTTLWRWAAARGWTRFPLMSFRKSSPPTPIAWSRDELNRLFDAAAKYEVPMVLDTSRGALAYKNGVACGPIMLALVRLCFETAERINAIVLLRWSDVDLDGRWVTFRADTRKGGDRAGDNVQKLSRRTVNALREMRTLIATRTTVEPDSTVFPKKDKATYLLHLRRILQAAGLPADRRHMFHCLRRTHATHLYIAGGDPTFSLGHTTEQMTREYYLDPRYVRQDYAADLLAGGVVGPLRRLWRRAKAAAGIW